MVYDPGTSGEAEDKAVEIARRVRFLDFIIWVYGVEIRPLAAVSIKAEYIAMHDQTRFSGRNIIWAFQCVLSY